jgi:hypothetical protein
LCRGRNGVDSLGRLKFVCGRRGGKLALEHDGAQHHTHPAPCCPASVTGKDDETPDGAGCYLRPYPSAWLPSESAGLRGRTPRSASPFRPIEDRPHGSLRKDRGRWCSHPGYAGITFAIKPIGNGTIFQIRPLSGVNTNGLGMSGWAPLRHAFCASPRRVTELKRTQLDQGPRGRRF